MTKSRKNKRRNPGKGRLRRCGFNLTSDLTAWASEREIKTKLQGRSRTGMPVRHPHRAGVPPGTRQKRLQVRETLQEAVHQQLLARSWKIYIIPHIPGYFEMRVMPPISKTTPQGRRARRDRRLRYSPSSQPGELCLRVYFLGMAFPLRSLLLSRQFLGADSPVSVPLSI